MKSFVIIGGGITGVTTAYVLANLGYDVTIIERHRYVGMETSFANGDNFLHRTQRFGRIGQQS